MNFSSKSYTQVSRWGLVNGLVRTGRHFITAGRDLVDWDEWLDPSKLIQHRDWDGVGLFFFTLGSNKSKNQRVFNIVLFSGTAHMNRTKPNIMFLGWFLVFFHVFPKAESNAKSRQVQPWKNRTRKNLIVTSDTDCVITTKKTSEPWWHSVRGD